MSNMFAERKKREKEARIILAVRLWTEENLTIAEIAERTKLGPHATRAALKKAGINLKRVKDKPRGSSTHA